MFKINKDDRKVLNQMAQPTWLSGLIAVVVGLFITVGTIVAFSVNNSAVQQQLTSWQQNQPEKRLTAVGEEVNRENDKPTLGNSWSLLVLWSVIGLVVYSVAGAIVHSLSEAERLKESLGYVNARPEETIRLTVAHVIMRVIGAIALGIMISVFIKEVVPYSITAAHASAAEFSFSSVLYAFLSFAIVPISLHIITIFLRISLGRVRLFSSEF